MGPFTTLDQCSTVLLDRVRYLCENLFKNNNKNENKSKRRMSSTHASDSDWYAAEKDSHSILPRRLSSREFIQARIDSIISSRRGQTEDSSSGDTISHVTPEPEQLFETKRKQDQEVTPNPNSSSPNLSTDIADMLNRIDATLQHHRDQYQGIVLFAKDATYHVNQSETHMNDVRSDSIENAVETAGAIDQLANAKANKKKKQKKKKKEAENNNNRQALMSRRKRIATSILTILLLIVLILLGLLFVLGPRRTS